MFKVNDWVISKGEVLLNGQTNADAPALLVSAVVDPIKGIYRAYDYIKEDFCVIAGVQFEVVAKAPAISKEKEMAAIAHSNQVDIWPYKDDIDYLPEIGHLCELHMGGSAGNLVVTSIWVEEVNGKVEISLCLNGHFKTTHIHADFREIVSIDSEDKGLREEAVIMVRKLKKAISLILAK